LHNKGVTIAKTAFLIAGTSSNCLAIYTAILERLSILLLPKSIKLIATFSASPNTGITPKAFSKLT